MTREARFVTGPTMRHVSVMTATGAVGLTALFLVDAANLFYISLIGRAELTAALGYAATLQFFLVSVSIGLSIAATAVVSRAVGAGDWEGARQLAASSMATLVAVLALVAAGVWIWRDAALGLLGASGEARAVAGDFLAIVLPSLPLLGIGMVSGGLLRAVADARRAMWVTLGGGLIGAVLDPIFIFGLGLEVTGAAIVSVIARVAIAAIALRAVLGVHDMVGRIGLAGAARDARQILAIALPAVATQVSTPFGNAWIMRLVSEFGDEAAAGWAVLWRVISLVFGGIFALSGAVGPILGQNWGAGRLDRVGQAFRDAILFAALYVAVAWFLMWHGAGAIVAVFGLTGAGAEIVRAFGAYGAGLFAFTAALFVSNAAFNTLGRPLASTAFNWARDAAVIPILVALVGVSLGAEGAVVVQGAAGMLVGSLALAAALRHVARLGPAPIAARAVPAPVADPLPETASEGAGLPIRPASG
ncbi:MATE family efflux transporter [Limibaculum sp. FT325]|uniref:MATE family efflux transporter n=1 Tax=Thermohalobaculum sediminis TaxID=2939436 RepID=UPI0020BFD069|nr:MATE family efflux transporter [Limibaculum sediminis]MCL5778007.1 MATE family efflux transporter [Limibaculum sediminis]